MHANVASKQETIHIFEWNLTRNEVCNSLNHPLVRLSLHHRWRLLWWLTDQPSILELIFNQDFVKHWNYHYNHSHYQLSFYHHCLCLRKFHDIDFASWSQWKTRNSLNVMMHAVPNMDFLNFRSLNCLSQTLGALMSSKNRTMVNIYNSWQVMCVLNVAPEYAHSISHPCRVLSVEF